MKITFVSFAIILSSIFFYSYSNSIEESEMEKPISIPKTYSILKDLDLPKGYTRSKGNGYSRWIRSLELRKDNIVYYYNGNKKANQSIHLAVLKMDVGDKDLQQCADACMRIRAEYLFQKKKYSEINFLLASGKWNSFTSYTKKREYQSFRKYMNYIFAFANTASLKKQLKKVLDFSDIKIGDVLVQSGNPYGHAVTVMDICKDSNGNKMFMISQSYMPAQNIEILINPKSPSKSPWYPVSFDGNIETPEWTFNKNDLRRF